MEGFDFETGNEEGNRQAAEHQAALVVNEIEGGVRPDAALHVRVQENMDQNSYFSALNSQLLAALADRDACLDLIPAYIDDLDERFVVDEHRTPVRLALATATLRGGDRAKAEEMFFDAGARSQRTFRKEDLDRINDFVNEWTRRRIVEATTP